jgi:hypothetical protein
LTVRPTAIARLGVCGLSMAASLGCMSAVIYSHVTVPLDTNLNHTPVNDAPAGYIPDSKNSFQYYIRVDWGSDAIGDIARKHGFSRVDYADLETLTVLWVWSQERVHLYGERSNP